jgi:hypothetical protein
MPLEIIIKIHSRAKLVTYTRNTCMQQPIAYIFQTLTYTKYRISNWSTLNAGSRLRQCCHGNTTILNFFEHTKNSWKIIAFNYITMNFRIMYCRYVILNFVSFDLNK